jgi:hypothetical protein
METNAALKKLLQKENRLSYLYQLARLGEITEEQFISLFYALCSLEIERALH